MLGIKCAVVEKYFLSPIVDTSENCLFFMLSFGRIALLCVTSIRFRIPEEITKYGNLRKLILISCMIYLSTKLQFVFSSMLNKHFMRFLQNVLRQKT